MISYFYIPTVYIKIKDNTLFFVHENNKILNLPRESIGFVVSAKLIESDKNYNTYDFISINLDKHIEDIFKETVYARVLLVNKLSDPDFLFGVLLDQLTLEEVKHLFPNYDAPESNAFVKVSINKANLSVRHFNEMLNQLQKLPYVCHCKIYHATHSMLYAHPLIYEIDYQIEADKIRRSVKQREKYSKEKKLLKSISFIYKYNDFKIYDNYVEFKARGKRYRISFRSKEVYENNKKIHVQYPASFSKEYTVLAKALTIIVNPDSISKEENS